MTVPKPVLVACVATASVLMLGLAASPAGAACVGSCGVSGANGDVTAPPSGATYGWVSTFGGVSGVGQLPGVGGTDGSTFTTAAFAANAGDNLHYHFNFVSSDGQNAPGQFVYEDYAWVQLVDATTETPVAMLFNARTEPGGLIVPGTSLPPIDPGVALNPSTVPITLGSGPGGGPLWGPLGDPSAGGFSGLCWGPGCGFTGWVQSDYTVTTAGSYKLVFGVSNWGDTIYDTGLAYAGLQIGGVPIEDGVPEPATWTILLAGFAGLGMVLRSRRRGATTAA